MKIELSGAKLLTLTEMSELAARLDSLHKQTIETIDSLQRAVETEKSRIARRWEGVTALGPGERHRVVSQQNAAALNSIRQKSQDALNAIMREAGTSYSPLIAQRPYYQSKAVVLSRQGLGTDRRTGLEQSAERARQVALAGLGQLAVGTGDLVLAAAVLNENDRRREADRGFSTADFLSLLTIEDFERAQQYLLIGENRMNAIALAIRVWQSARPAPVGNLSLAMARVGEDGAILDELAEIAEGEITGD